MKRKRKHLSFLQKCSYIYDKGRDSTGKPGNPFSEEPGPIFTPRSSRNEFYHSSTPRVTRHHSPSYPPIVFLQHYQIDIFASINTIMQSMTYNLQSFWESCVTKCTTFAIISSIWVILQSQHDHTKYGLQFTMILRNLSYRTYN